jgi:hypothetical protein
VGGRSVDGVVANAREGRDLSRLAATIVLYAHAGRNAMPPKFAGLFNVEKYRTITVARTRIKGMPHASNICLVCLDGRSYLVASATVPKATVDSTSTVARRRPERERRGAVK